MLTLVLTRHGATARSDPEQHLGIGIDIGLSPSGEAAARALARRLEGVAFQRIVSSPLLRARQTAAYLAAGRPVATDDRLREMDYGEWEGLTYEQIDARDAAFRRRWVEDPASLACPGGESGNDVAARARSFLSDALHASSGRKATGVPDGRLLVVAHATFNRILLCVVLGVPVRDYRRRFQQDPANLTVLRFPGAFAEGALLETCNDVSHAHPLPQPLAAIEEGAGQRAPSAVG